MSDGGGNKASGNGDPRQCTDIVCRPSHRHREHPVALAWVAAAISDAGVNIAAATCFGLGERAAAPHPRRARRGREACAGDFPCGRHARARSSRGRCRGPPRRIGGPDAPAPESTSISSMSRHRIAWSSWRPTSLLSEPRSTPRAGGCCVALPGAMQARTCGGRRLPLRDELRSSAAAIRTPAVGVAGGSPPPVAGAPRLAALSAWIRHSCPRVLNSRESPAIAGIRTQPALQPNRKAPTNYDIPPLRIARIKSSTTCSPGLSTSCPRTPS